MAVEDDVGRYRTEQALEALHGSSFGWALTCCGYDREEASEVLQCAYVKILEGKARFNGHSSIRTWVFGVVRRTAAERRRRRLVRDLALLRWARREIPACHFAAQETESDQERRAQRLRSLLTRVSVRQREILHLVFYEEISIEEAARMLSISIGTARTHYERGKAALRALMSAGRGDGMETQHEPRERTRPQDPRAVPDCTAGRPEVGR